MNQVSTNFCKMTSARMGAGALVLGLLASACGTSPSVGKNELAQWEDAEVSQYVLTYEIAGGAGDLGPKTVRVSNGVVAEIISEPDGFSLPDYTIEDLFVQLDEADIVIDAEFDSELGYPTLLDLDPIKEAIDDEFSVRVVSFEKEAG